MPAADDRDDDDWGRAVSAHKQRRLQRIGAVAFDLVAREGLAHVSMSSLARAVGVSRATLYNYVPDVSTALRAHLIAQGEAFHVAVTAAVAEESGAEAQLRRYVAAQVAYVAGHDHRAVAALAEVDPSLRGEGSAAAHRSRQAEVLDEILERGMREGVFRDAPVAVQATLIGRLLYSADELLHAQGLSEAEAVDAITALVFDGIGR